MFFNTRKEKHQSSEKRRVPRADFYQSSYFLPANMAFGSGAIECWFNNISEGGIAIETDKCRLKEGDEIKILYKIGANVRKDNLKIQFAYQVFNKFKYGCAFIDPDENRKFMIDEYCKMNIDKIEKRQ